MQNLFAHRPLSEPLELYRSEVMDLREKGGMREACRVLVAPHRRFLEVSVGLMGWKLEGLPRGFGRCGDI